MFGSMGQSNVKNLGNGGTMDGDVTITGDLTVSGGIALSLNEVLQGTSTIDINNTEALLVRKNSDGGDVFIVDTTNNDVTVGSSSLADGTLIIESNSSGDPKLQFTSTANRIGIMDFVEGSTLQGSIVYDHNGDNLKFATGSTNRTARFTVNETTSTFTSSLNVAGGILTLGTADTSSGHINAFENMSFNIDTDNDDTNRFFEFSINGSSGAGTELMRLTEAGLLGVGVTPLTKLHVKGSGEIFRIENDTNASGNTYISFFDTSAVKGYLGYTGGSSDHLNVWNAENAHVKIATNDTERITVLGGGNVGIGYSSPANALSVSGVITSGNSAGVGVGGTPSDSNTSEIGAGYINLGRDDTADAKQITFGKNGAVHSYIETTSAGLNIGGANVGIGVAPSYTLDLSTSSNNMARFNSSNGTGGTLRFAQGGNNKFFLGMFSSISGSGTDYSPFLLAETGLGLSFGVNGTASKVMTLDSSGNTGIGTSSPESLLHIQGDTTAQMQLHNTSSGNAPKLLFDGLVGANADYVLGSVRASWDTHTNIVSEIRFESGADTTNKDDGLISFHTSSASSSVTERMRINSDGTTRFSYDASVESYGGNFTVKSLNGSDGDATLVLISDVGASNEDTWRINADGSDNDLDFINHNNTRMTLTSGGNLNVTGTATVNGALIDLRASADTDSEIIFREGSTAKAMIFNDASTNSLSLSDGGGTLSSVVNINSSNVGIGIVPVASQKLQVKTASNINFSVSAVGSALRINSVNDAADATAPLEMNASSTKFLSDVSVIKGTTSSTQNVLGVGKAGNIESSGGGGGFLTVHGNTNNQRGQIELGSDNLVGDGSIMGRVFFYNLDGGSSVVSRAQISAMRDGADDASKLVFATEPTSGDVTDNFVLDANSRISLSNNDNNTGNTVFGNTAFNASSDNGSDNNTAIGYLAMGTGTVSGAENNTAVGRHALTDITSANYNTAVGSGALANATTGERNVAIGADALGTAVNADSCVAIGNYAMGGANMTADGTVAIGKASMQLLTSGLNVGVGFQSGSQLTTGTQNTLIGYQAGLNINEGGRNTAVGHSAFGGALDANGDESFDNTFIGFGSGAGNWVTAVSNKNTAVGSYSMQGAMNGSLNNTAIGYGSLQSVTTGDSNSAVGKSSATNINTGGNNTIIGVSAGANTVALTTGSDNTLVGTLSDVSASGASNQIVIGKSAKGQADNSVTLGNSSVTKVYIAPECGTSATQALVFKDSGGEQGQVVYDHGNGQFQFYVEGAIKARIESGGAIYLDGGGIKFPASQVAHADANTMDDYEEGTWEVTMACSTSGTLTLNSGQNTGSYTKVGNVVHVIMKVDIETVSSPDGFFTVGLPFTIGDGTHESKRFTGSVTITGTSLNCSNFSLIGIEGEGGVRVYNGTGTVLADDSADAIANGNDFYLSATYQV